MPIRTFQEVVQMVEKRPMLPPGKAWTRTSFTFPTALLERLEALRERVNATREKPDRFSRDAFLEVGLEWFATELEEELKKGGKSKLPKE